MPNHQMTMTGTVREIVQDQREPDRVVIRVQLTDTKTRPAFSITTDMAAEFHVGEKVTIVLTRHGRAPA
jgi:hypothetical protein